MDNKVYDYAIEQIDEKTTLGMMLKLIRPNSLVLECGSATGYMTRLMRERLNARVYIVEYVKNSFDRALPFAQDGICTDLMESAWSEKFKDIRFDYIIFADVLEHLYNPVNVLKRAVSLLKEEGSVLLSVPNIAHNDVLISFYHDDMEYTQTGLLDDSHIRFFTANSLKKLCADAGLYMESLRYVQMSTFTTEQARVRDAADETLYRQLFERKNGEVYQFVMEARHEAYAKEAHIQTIVESPLPPLPYMARLYFFNGAFTEESVLTQSYMMGRDTVFRFMLPDIPINALRFDPVEGMSCLVKEFAAFADDDFVDFTDTNGVRSAQGIIFRTIDPQFIFKLDKPVHFFEVRAHIEMLPEKMAIIIDDLQKQHSAETENLQWRLRLAKEQLEENLLNVAAEKQKLQDEQKQSEILRNQLRGEQKQSELLQIQLNAVKDAKDRMERTISWKITAPLRWIRRRG